MPCVEEIVYMPATNAKVFFLLKAVLTMQYSFWQMVSQIGDHDCTILGFMNSCFGLGDI